MPIRSQLGLGLALASFVLAQSGARAQPPAGTWTDPPARSAAPAAKPASDPVAEPAVKPAEPVKLRAAKPAVAAPARAEAPRKKPVRAARAASPRRVVAARPARRPEPAVRSAVVRSVRIARPSYRDWQGAEPVYVVQRVYDPRDPRLERLWSAEEAGYLTVRGRHVAYPDGRILRIRPSGDEADSD
ncbi:hypothetical protein [Methylobacterium radiodurans]|uniref:Uncharacterized protein n=1 Tax=Methylobacterium radiodurans TaxID=2202828 RepID=A0A2U8VXB2_9HYPH|nr:hypothetical protein [Methylobacterium radiodurans]AWN37902.1 hypothetical protein DK427_20995 [Methylobacterium radiodurans]